MWFDGLVNIHSAVQAIVILSLICTLGLALGKVHVRGISLGVAFVFFVGIVVGHFGVTVDHNMLEFAESFGLTMFVYVLGLYVGPNFFGSMRREGISLNLWSMAVILVGTLLALVLCWVLPVSLPDMVGILCGATTNTLRPRCRPTSTATAGTAQRWGSVGMRSDLSLGRGGRHPGNDAAQEALREAARPGDTQGRR